MHTLTRRLAGVALSLASVAGMFVAVAPQAEAAATVCASNTYSYSLTTKTCVVYLQKLLNAAYAFDTKYTGGVLGPKRVLDADGKYGTLTQSAVTNLQKHIILFKVANGSFTHAKVDGVTGVQTWMYLCDSPVSSVWYDAGCDKVSWPYAHVGLM
jgi:hypothetical protein